MADINPPPPSAAAQEPLEADVSFVASLQRNVANERRTLQTSRLIARLETASEYQTTQLQPRIPLRGADQGNGSDTSERTSIFSEIMKYREENGRRFHGYKDGNYLLVWSANL